MALLLLCKYIIYDNVEITTRKEDTMPEYILNLRQTTVASLLVRLSLNACADYSVDGTIWYPLVNSVDASDLFIDNNKLQYTASCVLTATTELPTGCEDG